MIEILNKLNKKGIFKMNKKTLETLAQLLDQKYGSLSLNQITINNVSTELDRISEVIENTSKKDITALGLTMKDIDHSIHLLADLLTYTTKDLSITLEEVGELNEAIFNQTVSGNGGGE